jgi:predicted Zn-dependent protease
MPIHANALSRPRRALALLLAFALLLGPLLAPLPPARAGILGDVGVQDEVELGRKIRTLVQARFNFVEDPEIAGYVEEMVQRLKEVMPPQPFPIESHVIRDNAMNAFAIPAGGIYVHTGLILNLNSEDELAGVLAHELAHVSQRHIAERLEKMQAVNLASLAGMLAGVLLGGSASDAMVMGSAAAGQTAMLKYSRDDEREADQVGLNYLSQAGYDPRGMVQAFEEIRRMKWLTGGGAPEYLSTHPAVEERIGRMDQRLTSMGVEKGKPGPGGRFLRVQTLVRARYTDAGTALSHFDRPLEDLACLEKLGLAIVLSRLSRMDMAQQAFEAALECGRGDSLFHREAGRFQFTAGDTRDAAMHLQKAVLLNPKDLIALFFYARLLGEQGQTDQASEYFERILRKLPRDGEVHYHYGRMLGQAGRLFQAHLHLAYSAFYGHDKKQAEFHLKKARALARGPQDQAAVRELEQEMQRREELT